MPRPSLGRFVLGMAESEPYRRSTRIPAGIPITICGKDKVGCAFEESTDTIDIGKQGVRTSTFHQLLANAEVRISNDHVGKARPARVVWQGRTHRPDERAEIGVEFLEPFEAGSFWTIESPPDDWLEGRLALTTSQKLEYFWARNMTLQMRPELEALPDAAEPLSDLMPPVVPAVDQETKTVCSSGQEGMPEVVKPDDVEAPLPIEAAIPSVEPPWRDGWVPSPAPQATAEADEKDRRTLGNPQKAPVNSRIDQPPGDSPAAALNRLAQMLCEQADTISQGVDRAVRSVESAAEAGVARLQIVRQQIEDQLETARGEHQKRIAAINASGAEELRQNSEALLANFQKQLQRMVRQEISDKIINENPISPRELDATIHPGLNYVISKAPAPSPVDQQIIRPVSVQVIPPVTSRPRGTHPLVWVLLALMIVGALGAGGYFFLLRKPGPPAETLVTTPANPPAPNAASTPATPPATAQAEAPAPAASTTAAENPPPTEAEPKSKQAEQPKAERETPAASVVPTPVKGARAEPVPKFGQILVTSNLSGARISIDNRTDPSWVTPHQVFQDIPAGTHLVVVSKEGYDDIQQNVTIEGGRTSNLNAQLSVSMGEVDIITVPAGLEVLIDGKSQGPSPARVMVTTGEHRVTINRPEAEPYQTTIVAKSGVAAVKTVRLGGAAAPTGIVEVRTIPPGASVLADDQPVGGSTPTSFRLAAGHHVLVISKSGSRPIRQEVDVTADQTFLVNVTLPPQ